MTRKKYVSIFIWLFLVVFVVALSKIIIDIKKSEKTLHVFFLSQGGFDLDEFYTASSGPPQTSSLPLQDRWVANMVMDPLIEFHYGLPGITPDPAIVDIIRDTVIIGDSQYIAWINILVKDSKFTDDLIRSAIQRTAPELDDVQLYPSDSAGRKIVLYPVTDPYTPINLMSAARPAVWDNSKRYWDGYGFYRFSKKVKRGVNKVVLDLRDKNDPHRPDLPGHSGLPEKIIFKTKPYQNAGDVTKLARSAQIIVVPDSITVVPEKFEKVTIPMGFVFVAFVLGSHPPDILYSIRSYLAEILERNGVKISRYWIPEQWLTMGRGKRILDKFEEDSLVDTGRVDTTFKIGIIVGGFNDVEPINFENFVSKYLVGAEDVRAIQSEKDLDGGNFDVVIYKTTFDIEIDPPSKIYKFACHRLHRDLCNAIRTSKLTPYGAPNRDVLDRAESIQKSLHEVPVLYPLFTVPITVLIDTTVIKSYDINYREGFARFVTKWRWEF